VLLREKRSMSGRRILNTIESVLVVACLALAASLIPTTSAFATTNAIATTTTTPGSLAIGTTTPETITVPVAGTGNGILPSASWSDTTGTGDGWNGTVALSDFTYTGSWKQTSGTTTALGSATSAFTGTGDGVEYTVTVGPGATTSSTPYTWTTNDSTDSAGGSGTATNGTPVEIGTRGIYINFASGTSYASGDAYQIDAGTLSSSALSLDSSASGASITPSSSTTSANPTFVNSGTTVVGGGVGSTTYGTAVKFVSASVGTGEGTYTIDPGASVSSDSNSWAASYTAGVQYSIVSGP